MRNPFAIRDGKRIVISDVPYDERKNCNCKCPYCEADFDAKMGEIRAYHFAHKKGSMCDELAAYLNGLYGLIKQFIENDGKLYIPAVIADFNISDSILEKSDFVVSETTIKPRTHLIIENRCANGKKYVAHNSSEFSFDSCEIETTSDGVAETLVLALQDKKHDKTKKLAIKIKPPSTVCKDLDIFPYKGANIATLVFDASDFEDEFHTFKSDELQQLIMSEKSLWYWIYNHRYTDAFPKIIDDTKKRQKILLEAITKEEVERQKALEEKRQKLLELEKAKSHANTMLMTNMPKKSTEDYRVKHYRETGKFTKQNPETGKWEICELKDIKPNRLSTALIDFDTMMFETKLEEAFSGRTDSIVMLICKLHSSTPEEQNMFKQIYERYMSMKVSDELIKKIDIMNHIVNESMLYGLIENTM
ncbi:MAG: hypothetical protein FWF76_00055 [Oscillospiraceae bacterium]|nr:hypothetical protein [Oscillospiraceae bacterium]